MDFYVLNGLVRRKVDAYDSLKLDIYGVCSHERSYTGSKATRMEFRCYQHGRTPAWKDTRSNVTHWYSRKGYASHYSFDFPDPTPQISAPGLFRFLPTSPGGGSTLAAPLTTISALALFNVSSASRSMRVTSSSQDGMS